MKLSHPVSIYSAIPLYHWCPSFHCFLWYNGSSKKNRKQTSVIQRDSKIAHYKVVNQPASDKTISHTRQNLIQVFTKTLEAGRLEKKSTLISQIEPLTKSSLVLQWKRKDIDVMAQIFLMKPETAVGCNGNRNSWWHHCSEPHSTTDLWILHHRFLRPDHFLLEGRNFNPTEQMNILGKNSSPWFGLPYRRERQITLYRVSL